MIHSSSITDFAGFEKILCLFRASTLAYFSRRIVLQQTLRTVEWYKKAPFRLKRGLISKFIRFFLRCANVWLSDKGAQDNDDLTDDTEQINKDNIDPEVPEGDLYRG